MSKQLEVVGLDVGNGFVKSSDVNGDQVIESIYSEFDYGMNVIGKQELPRVYTVTKFDSEKYVLGQENVNKYGRGAINTLDMENRLNQRSFQILLQLALANVLSGHNDAKIILIVGVPEGEKLSETQKAYSALTQGINVIELNGKSIVRNVQTVKSLHQPSGLLFDLYLNENGYVKEEGIVNGKVMVIDIGEGTTDISIFNDLRKTQGFSIKTAVSEVSRRVLNRVESQIKTQVNLSDVQNAIRSGASTLKVRRDEVEIQDLVQSAKKSVIDRIFTEIQTRIPDRREFDHIVFGGGGAGFFNDSIQNWEKDTRIVTDQTAIARGFRKYGIAVAREQAEKDIDISEM